MSAVKKLFLLAIYLLASIQFVWCYLWMARPYVNTLEYEQGLERMPFQGRCLMMWPMRWAHDSKMLNWLTRPFGLSTFWFPRTVFAESLAQSMIDLASLVVAGFCIIRIYQASSARRTFVPLVYPLLLIVCSATYIMHTVQNFRYIYDLPSLAFFSIGFYLLYFQRHWIFFVLLFLVATVNRETTVLLLPLYLLTAGVRDGQLRVREMFRPRVLLVTAPLGLAWILWQVAVWRMFTGHGSEFYPRLDWNIKSLLAPHAWPQMLSACAYLLPFIVIMHKRVRDPHVRAWLWIIPCWVAFMFSFGILVETRVFGELIPLVVCSTMLILEDLIIEEFEGVVPAGRTLEFPLTASQGRRKSIA